LERNFHVSNRTNDLSGVLDEVEDFCRVQGVANETAADVRLVAEEVLTNIVKYAHDRDVQHAAELRLSASPQSVRMEFRDEGLPFNPLELPALDPQAVPGQPPIGGLGVHLVRALVDDASYSREGRVNVLILIKHAGSTV
jgi:anti-sigma regulatory factor (Ser/Thr protein kinase)